MTICFHVDNCKLSHANPKVMDNMIAGSGKMLVSCGKKHQYLGMNLDYITTGQVKITVIDYVEEVLTAFSEADPKSNSTKTSAAPEDLFKINQDSPKLDPSPCSNLPYIGCQDIVLY
jgi:hypothetical protein